MAGATDRLVQIRDLRTHFYTQDGLVKAVDGVDLDINRGETLGVVGESGCGKSVTALSLLRLVPDPPGKIVGGEISFADADLLRLSEAEMRGIRGNDIAMIFQEPMTSLNPVYTSGFQIAEAVELHQSKKHSEAIERAIEMLRLVGVASPERRVHEHPHQLSGGMRQRVMIAMALSCNPQLLIADEPTTALDVTIQAQILDLMKGLKEKLGMAIMLITHDLGVVAEMAERVVVMYSGRVVEEAPVGAIFAAPQHPYTQGLLGSIPRLDLDRDRLNVIGGAVPDPLCRPLGCSFAPRCPRADRQCEEADPELRPMAAGMVACHHPGAVEAATATTAAAKGARVS